MGKIVNLSNLPKETVLICLIDSTEITLNLYDLDYAKSVFEALVKRGKILETTAEFELQNLTSKGTLPEKIQDSGIRRAIRQQGWNGFSNKTSPNNPLGMRLLLESIDKAIYPNDYRDTQN